MNQTALDNTVTIRFRDTMLQDRVEIGTLRRIIMGQVSFRSLFT
jgi:glycyl-tRNA synthetase (class II)